MCLLKMLLKTKMPRKGLIQIKTCKQNRSGKVSLTMYFLAIQTQTHHHVKVEWRKTMHQNEDDKY